MWKRNLIIPSILLTLAIAAGGYYLFFGYNKTPQADIRKFIGDVTSIETPAIRLHGVFDGPAGTLGADLSAPRDFSFQVDTSTRYKKLETRFPSRDELPASAKKELTDTGATKVSFNLEDLPRTESEGSLDDLKNAFLSNPGSVSVEADFLSSISNSEDSVASFVFYHVFIKLQPPENP